MHLISGRKERKEEIRICWKRRKNKHEEEDKERKRARR